MSSIMTEALYEQGDREAGYSIHEARTGWVITYHSRYQGTRDGEQLLAPYGSLGLSRGTDLTADWNDLMTNGEVLARWARDEIAERRWESSNHLAHNEANPVVRCLDRGTLLS